jgi:hypothetical protein
MCVQHALSYKLSRLKCVPVLASELGSDSHCKWYCVGMSSPSAEQISTSAGKRLCYHKISCNVCLIMGPWVSLAGDQASTLTLITPMSKLTAAVRSVSR